MLVISGPNAGGKTVTLTAVGLSIAMVQAGLPIPAGPLSRVPLVGKLFTAVGDAQDLSQGLSTFTAHLAALGRILAGAGAGSLALIDEMAADTDPREGAALAVSVLEELLNRGALVVVTTHLEPLKALAMGDPRFTNAAVGFDPLALAPTFRLTIGTPGQSSALEVARRCGLPEAVVERARQNLSAEVGPLGAALAALESERSRLAKVRADLEIERATERERRQELEVKAEALSRRQAEVDAGARQGSSEKLQTLRERVGSIVAELQRAPEMAAATVARQAVAQAIASQERALAAPAAERTPAPAARFSPGQRVHSRSLAKDGDLLSVDGETGMVAFGAIKLRQPLTDLGPAEGKRPAPPADRNEKLRRASRAAGGALDAPSSRCDLRGLRAEEAVREAERFLDHAFSDGISEVLLLHGLGSGALKASLRSFLSSSSYVRSFHAAEAHQGGEGTTIVELADG